MDTDLMVSCPSRNNQAFYGYGASVCGIFMDDDFRPNTKDVIRGSPYHIYYSTEVQGSDEHGSLTDPKNLYVGSWWKHLYTISGTKHYNIVGLFLYGLSTGYKSIYSSSPY